MTKFIFALLTVAALSSGIFARGTEEISISMGKQKTADRGRLTIKFEKIIEDSRCPPNARCIWAGNARIRLAVSKGKMAPKYVELNTGEDPRSVKLYGYTIKLEGMTQNHPEMMGPFDRPLVATLSVKK